MTDNIRDIDDATDGIFYLGTSGISTIITGSIKTELILETYAGIKSKRLYRFPKEQEMEIRRTKEIMDSNHYFNPAQIKKRASEHALEKMRAKGIIDSKGNAIEKIRPQEEIDLIFSQYYECYLTTELRNANNRDKQLLDCFDISTMGK